MCICGWIWLYFIGVWVVLVWCDCWSFCCDFCICCCFGGWIVFYWIVYVVVGLEGFGGVVGVDVVFVFVVEVGE